MTTKGTLLLHALCFSYDITTNNMLISDTLPGSTDLPVVWEGNEAN